MTVYHMIPLFKMEQNSEDEKKQREEKSGLNHLKDGISKYFSTKITTCQGTIVLCSMFLKSCVVYC